MGNPQKWHVRFFVARTFDVTVESDSLEDAWNRAHGKFCKRRGKGFRKGRDLIVLKPRANPANEAAIQACGRSAMSLAAPSTGLFSSSRSIRRKTARITRCSRLNERTAHDA